MRIARLMNPEKLNLIEDKILPNEGFKKEDIVDVIRENLTRNGDKILVMVALDVVPSEGKGEGEGEEEIKVLGFFVATAPPRQDHTFLFQIWCDPEFKEEKVVDRFILKLCSWTQEIGRSKVKGETTRSSKAILRRWGFEEVAKIVELDVENFEDRIIKNMGIKESSLAESKEKKDV